MTNPEVETAAPKSAKSEEVPASGESTSTEGTIKSEFLERVSEIPAVSAAKDYGTAAYNQVKQYNRFTAAALSAAETAALYFAVTAKPFLEKIQPQAQLVDNLACKGLDTVEEKVPFLMKQPEELVEDARKLCYSTVDKGYQKVEEIKTLGTETLSSVKNYGLQKANDALTETESLVDKYLPPAFGEGSHEAEDDDSKSVPERASKLTSKIGLRIYGHGIKQLLPVHKLSQESVAKLLYTVDLLQHLKENYINKSVQEYVDEAKVKATWIWEELNKEPAVAEETAKSLEQRMLSLARRMTSILVHAYNVTAVPISALPKTYQEGFQTAHRYATELFSQFDQATNAGDVTILVLQGIREKLSTLETVIHCLSSQSEQIEMQDLGSSEKSEDVKDQESESIKEQKSEAGSSH
ncbi:Perilipin-5, partial [Stegodyphus mimosarum]